MPRPTVIGSQLDRRVTLNIMGVTRGAGGSAKPTLINTVNNVPAQFIPVGGRELLSAGQMVASFDARFRLRYRTDLKAKDEIVFEGVTYEVVAPPAQLGRRDGIEVMAKARLL